MANEMHKHLLTIVPQLPTDFEPWGQRSRETDWGPDCSCGCKHFLPLEGELRYDWGACVNPDSPRVGLLTFEHQPLASGPSATLRRCGATTAQAKGFSVVGRSDFLNVLDTELPLPHVQQVADV